MKWEVIRVELSGGCLGSRTEGCYFSWRVVGKWVLWTR